MKKDILGFLSMILCVLINNILLALPFPFNMSGYGLLGFWIGSYWGDKK